jgi:hypothetical protein
MGQKKRTSSSSKSITQKAAFRITMSLTGLSVLKRFVGLRHAGHLRFRRGVKCL